jgi:hypothetical protein
VEQITEVTVGDLLDSTLRLSLKKVRTFPCRERLRDNRTSPVTSAYDHVLGGVC